jgi:hypothetical protein
LTQRVRPRPRFAEGNPLRKSCSRLRAKRRYRMARSEWVFCTAGTFTRVYANPAPFGFFYLWTDAPPATIRYDIYSADVPFYFRNRLTLTNRQTTMAVGLPTPWFEVWVNPDVSGSFRGT